MGRAVHLRFVGAAFASVFLCWSASASGGGERRPGDGGRATGAEIDGPFAIAVGGDKLYISQLHKPAIRQVDLISGVIRSIRTIKGRGSVSGLALDGRGGLLAVEDGYVIRLELASGVVSVLAGNGSPGFIGDGGPATKASFRGLGIAVDAAGNVLIPDYSNHRIRRVDARTGVISTIAGTGERETSGDNGLAVDARLEFPVSLAVDRKGDLFFVQSGLTEGEERIRHIDVGTGIIRTVAGPGAVLGLDERSRVSATAVVVDTAARILFVDVAARIVALDVRASLATAITGTHEALSGDRGPATRAQFLAPSALAVDEHGNVFVADFRANRVHRIDARTGEIRTVAGNGKPRNRHEVIL
jgi:trimeric autotransporter adhesin